MGGIFESHQEIGEFYAGQEPQIDTSDLACPRCGFPDCEIVQMPKPETWFGRLGKARCRLCHVRFSISAIDDE